MDRASCLPAMIVLKGACLGVVVCLAAAAQSATETPAEVAQRHYEEGVALGERGQLDEAVKHLESAREILPGHPPILNALGAMLTRKGDLPGAEKQLLRALELDPTLDSARKNLAIGYFLRGLYREATPHLDRLAESGSTRPLAELLLGIIAAEEGRYPDAIRLLERVSSLAGQQPRALLLMARAYVETGQADKTLPLLQDVEKLSGLTPAHHVEAALLYSNLDRNEAALRHLDAAEGGPQRPVDIDYRRAIVLSRLDRNPDAIRVLEKSTEKNPEGRSLSLLAWIAQQQGEREKAVEALRKAIEVEPTVDDHYLDLSLLYVEHGNDKLAEEIIDSGLDRLPDSYRLLVQKGVILERGARKEKEEAIEAFRKAITLEKDHRQALAGLAIVLTHTGEVEQALELLRAGTERFPDDFYLHYLNGYVLQTSLPFAADKVAVSDRARASFEKSIELNPDHADSYYRLGKVCADRDSKKAIESYETALRLDPSDDKSKYQLARLYLKVGKREEGRRLMAEVRRAKTEDSREDRKPLLRVSGGRRPPGL